MSANALLLCREDSVLHALAPLLAELEIPFQRCNERQQARAELRRRKFDPVILDCDVEGATELLEEVREGSASRDSIVLALADDSMALKEIFRRGANLIVRKPILSEEAARILRTARALVMRMRRHFRRHAVPKLMYAQAEGMEASPLVLDVSEGGMCVQALERLTANQVLRLRFGVPDGEDMIEATGRVVWSDDSGRAGIRFIRLSDSARQLLRDWLGASAGTLLRPITRKIGAPWLGQADSNSERAQVTAPIRVAGGLEQATAIVLDAAIVMSSVVLFGLLVVALAGAVPLLDNYVATGAGLAVLHALLYRWFFFPPPQRTPGMEMSEQLAAAYVEFAYRRRLAELSFSSQ